MSRVSPAAALALVGLGAASAVLYWALAFRLEASNHPRDLALFLGALALLFALYGAAVPAAARAAAGPALAVVVVFAVGFRALLVLAGLMPPDRWESLRDDLSGRAVGYDTFLLYDNDVWRYLWDGRLQAFGLDPYRVTPGEVAEADFEGTAPPGLVDAGPWRDVLDNVSFQRHVTVYPPLAQLLFRGLHGVAPGSVLVAKLAMAGLDLVTCWLLALSLRRLGRSPVEAVLYAWNPLVIKEIAGSGHVDSLMGCLLALTVYLLLPAPPGRESARRAGASAARQAAALVAFALSVAGKLSSGILAGLVLRRTRRRVWALAPLALGLVSLPYLSGLAAWMEGLAAYARQWVFNPGPWELVRQGLASAGWEDPVAGAHLACRGLAVGVAVVLAARPQRGIEDWLRSALWTVGALLLLHAAVMPWYLVVVLPLAVLARSPAWLVLSGTVLLSYLFYLDAVDRPLWRWLEYGAFVAALVWDAARRRRTGARVPGAATRSGSPEGMI